MYVYIYMCIVTMLYTYINRRPPPSAAEDAAQTPPLAALWEGPRSGAWRTPASGSNNNDNNNNNKYDDHDNDNNDNNDINNNNNDSNDNTNTNDNNDDNNNGVFVSARVIRHDNHNNHNNDDNKASGRPPRRPGAGLEPEWWLRTVKRSAVGSRTEKLDFRGLARADS